MFPLPKSDILTTHDQLYIFVDVFARRRKLLGSGVLEVPQLVLHPVVELLRVLLPFQVKLTANGRVDADGEVVVDDVEWNVVVLVLAVVGIGRHGVIFLSFVGHANAPPI